MNGLALLSTALGWSYFLCWSCSFYPQLWLNFSRRHHGLKGLSPEFLAYNVTGFLFYAIFSLTTYTMERKHHLPQSVDVNDIAFAVHAFVVSALTALQFVVYGRDPNDPARDGRKYDRLHALILAGIWLLTAYNILLAFMGDIPWYGGSMSSSKLSVVDFLGYVKVGITVVKYLPQFVLNFVRKSTDGWSIGNVLLDLSGGSLSLIQQGLDSYIQGSMKVWSGDIPKLLLAAESIAFDLLFILQHYFLYPESRRSLEVLREPLIVRLQQQDADDRSPVDSS